jgi:hypothetical protein
MRDVLLPPGVNQLRLNISHPQCFNLWWFRTFSGGSFQPCLRIILGIWSMLQNKPNGVPMTPLHSFTNDELTTHWVKFHNLLFTSYLSIHGPTLDGCTLLTLGDLQNHTYLNTDTSDLSHGYRKPIHTHLHTQHIHCTSPNTQLFPQCYKVWPSWTFLTLLPIRDQTACGMCESCGYSPYPNSCSTLLNLPPSISWSGFEPGSTVTKDPMLCMTVKILTSI